jgi:hypothetical protein
LSCLALPCLVWFCLVWFCLVWFCLVWFCLVLVLFSSHHVFYDPIRVFMPILLWCLVVTCLVVSCLAFFFCAFPCLPYCFLLPYLTHHVTLALTQHPPLPPFLQFQCLYFGGVLVSRPYFFAGLALTLTLTLPPFTLNPKSSPSPVAMFSKLTLLISWSLGLQLILVLCRCCVGYVLYCVILSCNVLSCFVLRALS